MRQVDRREDMESACKFDSIEHVCMMGPYPGFPKRLSLQQVLMCCCFTQEHSPRGAGESERGVKQRGRKNTQEGVVLIWPLLGFIVTSCSVLQDCLDTSCM